MSTDQTLEERGAKYGPYNVTSEITQGLLWDMQRGASWDGMSDVQKTSLMMIASKLARLCNGDHNHVDSWHDIAGYATLVEYDLCPAGTISSTKKPIKSGRKK